MARGEIEKPFREDLPELLREHEFTYRRFAKKIGISQPYLTRVLSGAKGPSKRLLESSAKALGLQPARWREYREQIVVDAIHADPSLRDQIFHRLVRAHSKP